MVMVGVVVMLIVAGLLEGFGRQLIDNTWCAMPSRRRWRLIWGVYFYYRPRQA